MSILPVGIGPQEGGYQIERSLRFNSDDSAYLSRTPASAGNRKTWTISVWIKRTNPGTENWVYDGGSTSNSSGFQFTDTNLLRVLSTSSSGAVDDLDIRTTQVFRDPSAWYHIVLSVDTTQATSTNRVKLYVNGSQVTAFGTANYPTQNYDFGVNNNHSQKIGKWNISTGRDFSGYMADFYLVDGQALDPTSFGEYNSDTGVWQPKAYTGSYGTNGFYLDFADNSSTTALGYDAAGSNDWTPNNFSVTAGAGNDSLVDTPTNYGTDTGVGGEVRGNYATMNPVASVTSPPTFANGNLEVTGPAAGVGIAQATFGGVSGKYYVEVTVTRASDRLDLGIMGSGVSMTSTNYLGTDTNTIAYLTSTGVIRKDNANNQTGLATCTTGDVVGMAINMDSGSIQFYKNNATVGTAVSFTPSAYGSFLVAQTTSSNTSKGTYNFGQRPFAYTAPSGFAALCTQNLPEPTVVDGGNYFNAVLWTGNGSTQTITTGIANDLVWTKDRGAAYDHTLFDVIRTPGYFLRSNATSAEEYRSDSLTAFTSTGFSVGADSVRQNINKSGNAYVSWAWKAGGTGVTNTAGTITGTVTVSANTTAGFSIVTYTGNGTNGATVGHGLSTPSMVIVKNRSDAGSEWMVYHKSLTANYNLDLDLTWGQTAITGFFGGGISGVSSTTFSLAQGSGDISNVNTSSKNYVAYCFAPVESYSAFGSYQGNGSSDGSFIYTGFRPRFVLVKRTDTSGQPWQINDAARNPSNLANLALHPNASDAEATYSSAVMDILSNGFKLRGSDAYTNASGGTYIYAAFAENPFKYSLAR